MKKFDFWKNNKIDQHHRLTADELKAKFSEWLKTKEQAWLEYYSSNMVIRDFLTAKEGLSSVFKEEQYEEMYGLLKPLYLDYTYPKEKA